MLDKLGDIVRQYEGRINKVCGDVALCSLVDKSDKSGKEHKVEIKMSEINGIAQLGDYICADLISRKGYKFFAYYIKREEL